MNPPTFQDYPFPKSTVTTRDAELVEIIAPGLAWYSDPGHAWLVISPSRLDWMQANTPELLVESDFYHAGQLYFEEDCEYARVALAFPADFYADIHAAQTFNRYHPDEYKIFLRSQALVERLENLENFFTFTPEAN